MDIHSISFDALFNSSRCIKDEVYSLTTIVSWCCPSNGKNSLTQTSKPTELTFSSHIHIASSGFVSRVYFAETNTDGCPLKLYKCSRICVSMVKKEISQTSHTNKLCSKMEDVRYLLARSTDASVGGGGFNKKLQ